MSVEAYISSMFSPWHWALLAVFVLFFAAYGVGSFVNTKVPVIDFSFGIYGLSLLGLTISLQLPSAILLVVMLLFAVWGAYRFFSLLKFQWLHLLIIAIGAITLGSALLPPFLWDEQVYQVALPWHYLQNRSTAVLIDNPYSAYPALPHFFLLNTLTWGGINLPRLAVWLVTLIFLQNAIHEYKKLSNSWLTGMVIVFSLAFTTVGVAVNQGAYAECYTMLFCFAGVIAYYQGTSRKWAIISGALAGMASAVKLTSLSVVVLLFVAWLLNAERRKEIFAFIFAAFIALLPFILRIWIATGDPVYPFGAKIFGTATTQLVAEYHQILGSYRYGLGFVTGLVLGWISTAFHPLIYDGLGVGWGAPILVTVAIFYSWHMWRTNHKKKNMILKAMIALAASYSFWALTAQQSRFLYPLLWGVGAIVAYLSLYISNGKRIILMALLIVVTFFGMNYSRINHYVVAWKNLSFARTQPVTFLSHATHDPQYFTILNYLISIPNKSKIGLLWERRTLYLPRVNQCSYQIIHPRFQELITPPPKTATELFHSLSLLDYIWLPTPKRDVDYQIQFQKEREKLEMQLIDLLRQGKLSPSPNYNLLKVNR